MISYRIACPPTRRSRGPSIFYSGGRMWTSADECAAKWTRIDIAERVLAELVKDGQMFALAARVVVSSSERAKRAREVKP